ncbi:Phosphonates transport ATP-binding protein phnL [Fibrisoma limi BUZ 3]|uniref:Phosphonates transport ATP-binding protein phnL n=1 Tax=Fibrisoma limi BUZ 3 TaxID=1185876 RepID=I2GCE0_9BACT|nr:ATP-binding cassette domain-containing protein [Fibrisoma limi]CCH51564.1 Phosphonates transport ATP-binding protein phnL [Fibrisoma limi BUZ 3]
MPPILDVRHYTKRFDMHVLNGKRINALTNVSFSLEPGEIVGLVGKSGSGKSTLMKSIYRTYLATSGAIYYQSLRYGPIDLVRATDHQIIALRRDEITYCSQFLSVIPRVSAADVVAEGLFRRGAGRTEAWHQSRDYLDRLGLPQELWDAYPSTFSGGEQQRINVARAIIARPRLLLIDEPTASLDQRTKDVVIDMIIALKAEGTSVLCISHDLYTLDRLADRRIELKDGHIVATTSPVS